MWVTGITGFPSTFGGLATSAASFSCRQVERRRVECRLASPLQPPARPLFATRASGADRIGSDREEQIDGMWVTRFAVEGEDEWKSVIGKILNIASDRFERVERANRIEWRSECWREWRRNREIESVNRTRERANRRILPFFFPITLPIFANSYNLQTVSLEKRVRVRNTNYMYFISFIDYRFESVKSEFRVKL